MEAKDWARIEVASPSSFPNKIDSLLSCNDNDTHNVLDYTMYMYMYM